MNIPFDPELLVLRPWLNCCFGKEVYGHIDAIVMECPNDSQPTSYGEISTIDPFNRQPRLPRREGLRFQCQIDEARSESYAWQTGYRPSRSEIFTWQDQQTYGLSLHALRHAMKANPLHEEPARTLGTYLVHLTRILGLSRIAILAAEKKGHFDQRTLISGIFRADEFQQAAEAIDKLVLEVQQLCASYDRLGRTG